MTDSTLVAYYAAVDAGDFDQAMSLLDADVEFAMHLPSTTNRGRGRDGLRGYLTGRGDVVRAHVPLRVSVVDDVEFVHGAVVEDGVTTTGHFTAAVSKTTDGLIARYQVVFATDFPLLP
jgi:ketosteroid isomerase-like protein